MLKSSLAFVSDCCFGNQKPHPRRLHRNSIRLPQSLFITKLINNNIYQWVLKQRLILAVDVSLVAFNVLFRFRLPVGDPKAEGLLSELFEGIY